MARKTRPIKEEAPSEYILQKQRDIVQQAIRAGGACPSKLLGTMKQGERNYLIQAQLTQKSAVLEEAKAADYEGARVEVRKFLKGSTPYGACRVRCFWKMFNPDTSEYVFICLSDMWAMRKPGGITYLDRYLTKEEVLRA